MKIKKPSKNPAKTPMRMVNDDVNETYHHLHDDIGVSDGSPLNAEPPSTQSTEKRYNVFGQELDEHGFVKRKPE